MIGMLIVGLPFIGFCLWLYLRIGPNRKKKRIPFEVIAIILLGLGIYLIFRHSYFSMKETNDSAWWPVLGFFYSLGFVPLYLIAASVVRKLVFQGTEPVDADNQITRP
jgi:hypothetical protein